MMSAGVSISSRICRVNTQTRTVSRAARPAETQMMLATKRRSSPCSPEPKRWATGMANPLHTPVQKPMIIKLMEPVDPTAASEPTPSHLPTIMVSAML